jgi:GDP-mannose 6-dehydrogenase
MNGGLDLRYVRRVCEQIGAAIKIKKCFHVVAAQHHAAGLDAQRGDSHARAGLRQEGRGQFRCLHQPEFLREGTAVYDFYNLPKTVIGEMDKKSGDLLQGICAELAAPLTRTDIESAELVKYTDNVWHALKVGFANEIGNIAKQLGIDGHKAMEIFCQDTKLDPSPYYMKPGFAFGGSCLPKDVRTLTNKAQR